MSIFMIYNIKQYLKHRLILLFKHVYERLASIEGDKHLRYWRNVQIHFFKRELEALNIEFKEDMLIVFKEYIEKN
ncbi:hypothetical protein [Paraclostridium bifermentans]|uniref:hypothetical protein n=1 Tax=Paraclostridium bifermentans TaxID=1490 RepID=UPI001FF41D89|nr:hypothetical protein [Paraclostridium bifermentans]UOW68624.1 hypothetical protein MTR78_04110 [Paraclostridium bifermentans]